MSDSSISSVYQLDPAAFADSLDAVERPGAAARGLPNASYTAEAFHRFDREHVFGRGWVALAFCADHAAPGRVAAVEFMGLPLLVACGRDGDLAVFHNVCSHRGMRLVDGEKTTRGLLVCPYHAWSYDLGDLSGALKATPHIGGVGAHEVAGFCRAEHGLKAVRSHCWLGVLFIDLSGRAPPFADYAAPLLERYRPFIGDAIDSDAGAAQPAFDAGLALHAKCNWKLAVENYCEAYHLPWVHPKLNEYSPLDDHYGVDISDDFAGQGTRTFRPVLGAGDGDGDGDGAAAGDGAGDLSRHPRSPLSGGAAAAGDVAGHGAGDAAAGENTVAALPRFPAWPARKTRAAEYPVFYPNLLLGFQADHFFALIIHPLGPDRIREELRLFYPGDGARAQEFAPARRANLAAWSRVFGEDLSAVEGLQRGRHSPGFGGGVFSPLLDAPTRHFHRWVARRYRAALAAGA